MFELSEVKCSREKIKFYSMNKYLKKNNKLHCHWGAGKLTGERPEVVWAEFSTLS
jgi:hypothetical protein